MSDAAWADGHARCLGVQLAGHDMDELTDTGVPAEGETLLLLLNAHHDAIPFRLPALPHGRRWQALLDTIRADPPSASYRGRTAFPLTARSLALLADRPLAAARPRAGHGERSQG
jgi:glycogen operon protein